MIPSGSQPGSQQSSIASRNLETARLGLRNFPVHGSFSHRKACLCEIDCCLNQIWSNGAPDEIKEAGKLQVSANLETARLNMEGFSERRSLQDRKACLDEIDRLLVPVWCNCSPDEKTDAYRLQASASLERARLCLEELPEQSSLQDRKEYLCRIDHCLGQVFTNGSSAEKRSAYNLRASESLERARLSWEKFPELRGFRDRKECLDGIDRPLQWVFSNGTSAEKRAAYSLRASQSLEKARLSWERFPALCGFEDRKECLDGIDRCLQWVFSNGSSVEKRAAYSLRASQRLEKARLNWEKFPDMRDFEDRKECLDGIDRCLEWAFSDGSFDEKRAAHQLRVSAYLEKARLNWETLPKQCSFQERKKCLREIDRYLSHVLSNGSPDEKREAKELKGIVNQRQ